MILFLIFGVFVKAETMWVDANGIALYKTKDVCEKYANGAACFETDERFEKEFYELKNQKFVLNSALKKSVKDARKAKEDAYNLEKEEIKAIKQKLDSGNLTQEEILKLLKFIVKNMGE